MRGAGGTSIIAGRNGNPDLVFPFPAGCSVGYAAEFMNVRGNDLASFGVTPDQKIVVFEDWTDGDMDDDYWLAYVGEGTPTVNLDTDSNNDGGITAADDAIETSAPGRLVAVREHDRDPLAEVKINPIGLSTPVKGNITATLSAPDNIRVYADKAGTQPLFEPGKTSETWDVADALINPLPTTVYVAGDKAGSASLTWSVSVDGYSTSDTVQFTVVPVNIDTDSDNGGGIVHEVDSPIEENAPGRILRLRGISGAALAETQITSLGVAPTQKGQIKATLSAPQGLSVYADAAGKNLLIGPGGSQSWDPYEDTLPSVVYVAGEVLGESTLTWTVSTGLWSPSVSTGSGTGVLIADDIIRYTVVDVDLIVDDLPPEVEDGVGAVVWRNSDFSRTLPHPDSNRNEPGLPHYIPDYRDTAKIDPEYETQFTRGSASLTGATASDFTFQFVVSDPTAIILWTKTQWAGFTEVAGGWWKIPSGEDVAPPASGAATLDFWIEGLTATGTSQHMLTFNAMPRSSGTSTSVVASDSVEYRVIDTGIGVDGNRDGTIDFADSYDRQLTFWLNDDRETQEFVDPSAFFNEAKFETENVSGSGPVDAADLFIKAKRDLEDFAAIHLLADATLTSQMIQSTRGTPTPAADLPTYQVSLKMTSAGPTIRLFDDRPQSGPLDHVTNADAAARLLNARAAEADIGNETKILQLDKWPDRDGRFRYLFEAPGTAGKTTLEYTITVTYPQPPGTSGQPRTTSRTHTLDLDLREIKDFYTRMRVPYRDGNGDDRVTLYTAGTTELPHLAAAQPIFIAKTNGTPFLSGRDKVVLVHGWNMTDGTQTSGPGGDWKKAFAETAFKRLYWQGFRGEFTAFDWPTFADTEGPLQDRDPWITKHWYPDAMVENAYRNLTYNASEYQAWRSGQALMNYLSDIRSPNGATHLLAHSMGNVVAAEALRQWSASGHDTAVHLVNTYVAMQGAISAGAYGSDDTGAIDESSSDLYRHWPSGDGTDTDDYYMRGAESAAKKWVNMYNPDDAATAGSKSSLVPPVLTFEPDLRTGWPLNNHLKPTGIPSVVSQSTVWPDAYAVISGFVRGDWEVDSTSAVVGGPPSWRFVRDAELSTGLVLPEPVNGRLQPGPSAYETMAFLARSEAMPIGTMEVDFFGRENNINITTLGLSTAYEREWPGHSFQFNFDAATTDTFWARIRSETNFRSTLPPPTP
jgi:pimeloyl-ACP methyl ester carboxylesterase